jgi:hypothetical protein
MPELMLESRIMRIHADNFIGGGVANSSEHEKMVTALKGIVVPVLRESGFKGSFPHFRRPSKDQIDLLTFQFDRHGGGFVIEISKCPPNGIKTSWGLEIPPSKVTAHDVDKRGGRPRIGGNAVGQDHWYRFDAKGAKAGIFEQLAREIIPVLAAQAEPWWKQQGDSMEK